MSKRKIKLDLSGGWDKALEDAINMNNSIFIYAPFVDPSRVLRRNDRIYNLIEHKKGDTISVSVSEVKAIIRILLESIEIILTENEEITEYAFDCVDALHSYKDILDEIIDEYGLEADRSNRKSTAGGLRC